MRTKTGFAFAVLVAAAVTLGAQQATTTTSTTTTKTTTVSGEVVSYEPGKTIVIRDPNSRTVTYTLDSGLTIPAEVQVGRKVTVYSSPVDGTVRVQKITTYQSTAPDGSASTTTEVKEEPGYTSGVGSTSTSNPPAQERAAPAQTETTTTTKTTRVMGTVRAYEPGQSITILGPGSKTTTYTIMTDSQLPADVAVGKQVTVETSVVSGKPVARTVTYRTTTKTTKTKAITPQ